LRAPKRGGTRVNGVRRKSLRRWGRILAAGAVMAGCGPGCGWWRKGEAQAEMRGEEEAQEPRAAVVGEIASVHREDRFVLIKRVAPGGFGSGMAYFSLNPDGRTASLRPTGERLGRFYAADIQEGNPAPGDLVMARRMPPEEAPQATPVRQPGPIGGENRPRGGISGS